MSRLSLGRLAVGLVTLSLTVLVVAQSDRAEAQATGSSEPVKFDTFDSVELVGNFYPGKRGQKSPCAIFIHAVGEHRQKDGWDDLAKQLQGKDFAVLTFDLRGHGDSTNVGPSFYAREPVNQTLKSFRNPKQKDKISYKDFTQLDHYAVMVNDIAAAKRFLDRKNDSGECNSGSVILVGAESGATLGAMYLAWAAQQRRAKFGGFGVAVPSEQREIEDIAGAVWLSMGSSLSPNPNVGKVNVEHWIRAAQKVPMCFLYGEKDTKAAALAKKLNDNILHGGTPEKPDKPGPGGKGIKLTLRRDLKNTKLAGRELLNPKLDTSKLIEEYVTKVLSDRPASVWTKREIDRLPPVAVPFKALLR